MSLLKIFRVEILKLTVFMFCFSSLMAFLMLETGSGPGKLINYLIKIIF
jgi:hypothetical protein